MRNNPTTDHKRENVTKQQHCLQNSNRARERGTEMIQKQRLNTTKQNKKYFLASRRSCINLLNQSKTHATRKSFLHHIIRTRFNYIHVLPLSLFFIPKLCRGYLKFSEWIWMNLIWSMVKPYRIREFDTVEDSLTLENYVISLFRWISLTHCSLNVTKKPSSAFKSF